MIFQNLMGLGKSRCDVPSGTTQRHDAPPPNIKFQVFFHSRVPIETLHVLKDVDFYHLDSFYVAERCFCHHADIPEIVYVSCHDPDQSLSGDLGVDVNIVDIPITIIKSIGPKFASHHGGPQDLKVISIKSFKRYGL